MRRVSVRTPTSINGPSIYVFSKMLFPVPICMARLPLNSTGYAILSASSMIVVLSLLTVVVGGGVTDPKPLATKSPLLEYISSMNL